MILPKTYFPAHKENRMKGEGEVEKARTFFLQKRPNNLHFLLKNRYEWMLPYLKDKKNIVELGAGAGLSKIILNQSNITLTDIQKYPWINQKIDATDLPFLPNSVDVFICSHMIHHVAYPIRFLKNLATALKPQGIILINEVYTSLFLKLILRIMRHEGWSYEIDIFDEKSPANSPKDPWSANCAIPELLWQDKVKFETKVKELTIKRCELCELCELCEFIIFLISGGVIAKTKTVNLPYFILKSLNFIDNILMRIAPKIFPLGQRLVLQK